MPTCVICGTSFETRRKTQTCSSECRHKLAASKRAKHAAIGEVFGLLTIIGRENGKVIAQCQCGIILNFMSSQLRSGKFKSCPDCAEPKQPRYGDGTITTSTWKIWSGMISRTTLGKGHYNYAERGIKTCKEWKVFTKFREDMGERPHGKTLDRIDNDGDYCKENCRWATQKEQCGNRRITLFAELDGVTKPLAVWAEEYGIDLNVCHSRWYHGWNIRDILTKPIRLRKDSIPRPSAKSSE